MFLCQLVLVSQSTFQIYHRYSLLQDSHLQQVSFLLDSSRCHENLVHPIPSTRRVLLEKRWKHKSGIVGRYVGAFFFKINSSKLDVSIKQEKRKYQGNRTNYLTMYSICLKFVHPCHYVPKLACLKINFLLLTVNLAKNSSSTAYYNISFI